MPGDDQYYSLDVNGTKATIEHLLPGTEYRVQGALWTTDWRFMQLASYG